MIKVLKHKISPSNITLILISLSIIPRLLSPFASSEGTVYIFLCSIPFLILLPELVKNYEAKIKISELHKFSHLCLLLIVMLIIISYIFKDFIYIVDGNYVSDLVRRSLYLVQPLIYFSWYPYIKSSKKAYYLRLIVILIFITFICLFLPRLLYGTELNLRLNIWTAELTASLISPFVNQPIEVDKNLLGNEMFTIEVKDGCSSIPQTLISLYSMVIFYVCCRINSLKRVVFIFVLILALSFIFNSMRIGILSWIVIKELGGFDFWHEGMGSLIFAFVTMMCGSFIYYKLWCQENPVSMNK